MGLLTNLTNAIAFPCLSDEIMMRRCLQKLPARTGHVVSRNDHVVARDSSSSSWKSRQAVDVYAKAALRDNYRSRAAYKLLELDRKYLLIKPKLRYVVELGAAPGSWTQVVTRKLGQQRTSIIAVDLLDIEPIPGAKVLPYTDAQDFDTIRTTMDSVWGPDCKAQLVLSDMLHNVAGHADFDHENSVRLCAMVLKFCFEHLSRDGKVVMKMYWGKESQIFVMLLKKYFGNVTIFKPQASRKTSKEVYLVALGFTTKPEKRILAEPDDFLD